MLPGESLWGSPLSLAGRAPVAQLVANVGTDRPLCLHLPLPTPFAPVTKPQRFWKEPMGRMPGSAPVCLPVSQSLSCAQDSLAGSTKEPRRSRNSKRGPNRQTWLCCGYMTPPASAGFAASCSCPTQPLHTGLPTALRGWRSCLICNELIGAG